MSIADLGSSDSQRQTHIVEVLVEAFADLIERDPRAFRGKFRKMAADSFAFYRGSAPLFYSDMAQLEDPWVDEATSRVWIQGDLHAENYGTYMDSAGVLVFDVNDFDEAYLGHYTWDLQRMAASLALLGFRKALSDGSISGLIETYAKAYTDTVRLFATSEVDRDFRLTLDNTSGPLLGVLQVARSETRVQLLDALTVFEDGDRRLASGPGARDLDDAERDAVLAAYETYLDTIPEAKRQQSLSYAVKDVKGRAGVGIGSAGLRVYTLLVEGRTQALENDVILSMKQAATPSTVLMPWRYKAFADASAQGLAVGTETGLFDAVRVLQAMRAVSNDEGLSLSVPTSDLSYPTNAGIAVKWDTEPAKALFDALKNDEPLTEPPAGTVPTEPPGS